MSKTKDIDLIITGLDSFTLDKIAYLEKLRKLNRNLKIIVLFRDNINISFEKLAFFNIEKFIKKPFNIKVIEFIFHNLEKQSFKLTRISQNNSLLVV